MSQETRAMLTIEEGRRLGDSAAGAAVAISLGREFGIPTDVRASNVRSAFRPSQTTVILCQGVVSRRALVYGEKMVLVEAAAPLLGFYNGGFEPDGTPILAAAYGKLELVRAWNVMVGSTVNATVMTNVFHYQDMILHIDSNFDPKTPKPVEKE